MFALWNERWKTCSKSNMNLIKIVQILATLHMHTCQLIVWYLQGDLSWCRSTDYINNADLSPLYLIFSIRPEYAWF